MSNQKNKTTDKKKRQAPPPRKKKKKLADDRTPTVKKVDIVCKFIAVFLAICFFINVRVLLGGGGGDDTTIVPTLGIAASKVETDVMEPEIKAKSGVVIKVQDEYEKGDVVQYFDGEYNPVRRVIDVSQDNETYTVVGDNESSSQAVTVKAEDMQGRVFMDSRFLYGFLKFYQSLLGLAVTVLLSFILLMMSDILMFKKRRAEIMAKREAQAKKDARKLKLEQGEGSQADGSEVIIATEDVELVNLAEKRRQEKEAKLEKERAEIAAEMKQLQKKMKSEEEELKKGKGKGKGGKK